MRLRKRVFPDLRRQLHWPRIGPAPPTECASASRQQFATYLHLEEQVGLHTGRSSRRLSFGLSFLASLLLNPPLSSEKQPHEADRPRHTVESHALAASRHQQPFCY